MAGPTGAHDRGEYRRPEARGGDVPVAPLLSRILRDLEVRGLVRRSSDADDLRRGIVSISPTGTELVERAGRISEAIYAEIARRYGPLRLGELQAMLKELEEAMEEPIGLPPEVSEAAEPSSASE